jgi:predicted dehydrogenase
MIWLIGAGYMAREYAKVLKHMKKEFLVIGRGSASAQEFEKELGVAVTTGGLEAFLARAPKAPTFAIVAPTVDDLFATAKSLINFGVPSILLEKPGATNEIQLDELAKLATEKNCTVSIAYNRRFYESVDKAKSIIKEDGGVKSFCFEFTEWSHTIEPLDKSALTFSSWLLANSSHVIDMAFHLGGFPEKISCFSRGANHLKWHPKASIFSGAGIAQTGALFSYQANWAAPGRWSIDILTNKHRLIFRPLEQLQIQKIGSVAVEQVPIEFKYDKDFKPGLYQQTQAFLNKETEVLPTIQKQAEHARIYRQILEGSK